MTYSQVVYVLTREMVLKDPSDLSSNRKTAILEKFVADSRSDDYLQVQIQPNQSVQDTNQLDEIPDQSVEMTQDVVEDSQFTTQH